MLTILTPFVFKINYIFYPIFHQSNFPFPRSPNVNNMANSCRPVSRHGRYNATGPSSMTYNPDVSTYGNVDYTPSDGLYFFTNDSYTVRLSEWLNPDFSLLWFCAHQCVKNKLY